MVKFGAQKAFSSAMLTFLQKTESNLTYPTLTVTKQYAWYITRLTYDCIAIISGSFSPDLVMPTLCKSYSTISYSALCDFLKYRNMVALDFIGQIQLLVE